MVKLIYFEFKKLFKNSFIWSMLLLFITLNLISVHYQQYQKYEDPIYYSQMYETKLNEFKNIDNFYNAIEIELESVQDETLNLILNKIYDERKSIDSYSDKIESIIIQSESMSGISIFNDNKGSLSNIIKTADDYKKIQNVGLSFNNHLGLQSFLDIDYTELFILILLIMSLAVLIVNENNNGMNTLIKTTIFGEKETLIAKIVVIFIITILFNLLFYGVNLIYVNSVIGLKNLNDSIQSSKLFVDFTLPFNGFQMILLMIGYRIITIFSLVSVIFLLLNILKNSILVSGISLCFVALEAVLYNVVSLQSNLSIFRFLNVFSIFSIDFSLYKYNNLILFNHAFSMKEIVPILSLFVIVLSIMLSLIIKPVQIDNTNNILEKLRSKIKVTNHCNLFVHELYKSMIHNKGIIVLIVLLGYFGISIDSYTRSSVDTPYQLVIQEYKGELTNEKYNEIKKLKDEIGKAQIEVNNLEYQLNMGEIDSETYHKRYNELREILILTTGVNQLEEQLLLANGDYLGIVDVYGYERLFDVGINNSRLNGVMINFIVLLLCLILCISPIVTTDKNKEIDRLYVTNYASEKKIKWSKQTVTILYAFFINLIFNVWKYLSVSKYYILDGGQFSIGSVPSLIGMFNSDMNLYEAYNCMFIIRFIVLLLCAQIVLYFSNHNESIFATILKSIGVLVLPIMLIYIGFNNIGQLLPSYYFTSVNAFIFSTQSVFKLIIILILCLLLIFINNKYSHKNSKRQIEPIL